MPETADAVAIHWFRLDLRLADNPALTAAAAGRIVPVYVHDEEAAGLWRMGGASRWWLERSLDSLAHDLAGHGLSLVIRRGSAAPELQRLARETGARLVTCTRRIEPWAAAQEAAVRSELGANGVQMRRFAGALLFEPETVRTAAGAPFRVYTPFARACHAAPEPRRPLPVPALRAAVPPPPGLEIADLELYPGRPDWAGGFGRLWQPGETGAGARLDDFINRGLARYSLDRDRPDLDATSRLSPHLHFGEISPGTVWHRIRAHVATDPTLSNGADKLIAELLWREFSHHLLAQFPDLPDKPFRAELAAFPWQDDKSLLAAWQQGRTGYPIVDAGLRELWRTGTMHNRVRMIAASFLVKDLLIPWQRGAAWFWDTLVDADLANNSSGWQWVAGCGADAAPYFRIFNPVTQGQRFDPDGDYVRKWVPELARLPGKLVHAPWEAPEDALQAAGVIIGQTYPCRLIDHASARRRALDAFASVTGRGPHE